MLLQGEFVFSPESASKRNADARRALYAVPVIYLMKNPTFFSGRKRNNLHSFNADELEL